MFLRRFKSTGPDIIVLIFIIMVLLWIGPILHPELPSSMNFDERPMPFFSLLLNISGQSALSGVLITFVLVLLVAFLLVNFNTSDIFISERTFLPALIYVLFSGFFPEQQILNPALPTAVFLILAIRKIMDSYKVQYTAYSFFDAGLLFGCGGLFYANFIWFSLLLLIGIILIRAVKIREIIISLLGLAAPWFITFGFYYVAGNDLSVLLSDLKFNLFADIENFRQPALTIVALVILGAITLMCVVYLFSVINTKKIKSRKTFRLLIWSFLIASGVSLLIHPGSGEIFWLGGVTVAYLISHYLVFARKRMITETVFLLIIVMAAVLQIAARV